MVLLCGLPTETPFDLLADALEEKGVQFEIFSPRAMDNFYLYYEIRNGKTYGELACKEISIDLSTVSGVYNRIVDFSMTPEYRMLDPQSESYLKLRSSTTSFFNWLAVTKAKVVNHNKPMLSNSSKPYQMMLIKKCGFKIPESLITNNNQTVQSFLNKHQEIIYKSSSGVRSIVSKYTPGQTNENISSCPVLFQKCLQGVNYRVHVVGNEIFATEICSSVVDYRYAARTNQKTTLKEFHLPKDVEDKCFQLSKHLNLPFAGIDLMHSNEGEWYCFEVNPSPGYSYYENNTHQPISHALASYLAS